MSIPDWATTASGIIAVGAVFAVLVSRAFKHWLGEQLHELKELKPNGGGSTYDIVRQVAMDTSRAAVAAEQAAQTAKEAHAHIETILERVSNLEQVVIAWTPKKIAPVKKTATPRKRT